VVLSAIVIYVQLVYELFEKNTDRLREWIRPYVLPKRPVGETVKQLTFLWNRKLDS